MEKFSVIYDACVLYPAPLRDCLLRLALTDLFKARWTDQIHAEWMGALLRDGKFSAEKLAKVRDLMDANVRDAKVVGYEPLIEALQLPDPNDRHVLAAAIRCNADAIVTFNLKDFPRDALAPYGIDAIHPDDFIYYQIDMAPARFWPHCNGNSCRSQFQNSGNSSNLFNRLAQYDTFIEMAARLTFPKR